MRETAFTPREWRAIAVSAIVSCSPTARSMSISLSSGIEFSVFARAIKSFVTPLLAETTTITLCPSSTKVLILLATLRILSVLPTDVPPYFCTINDIFTPFIILAQKIKFLSGNDETVRTIVNNIYPASKMPVLQSRRKRGGMF